MEPEHAEAFYRTGETRESFNGRSVRVVYEDHGKCECGAVEMLSAVAWFDGDDDAALFVAAKAAARRGVMLRVLAGRGVN